MNNRITIPIRKFENTNETLGNTNFHKVKIFIMHTGENYNGSIFSEESIDVSIDTLSNIPILGYVYTDENENRDFKGHETDIDMFTDEDGRIKFREYYKEQPIGVIPETNEWFKEEIEGQIFLGCYGYIWKCYSNDAYDILLEDEEKEVSMEIYVKKCSYDDENRCNIDSFEFLGVTVLGAKVPGAMGDNCTLCMNFSTDEENKEFTETVDKLNKLLKHRKEDVSMEKNKQTDFEESKEEKDEVCPDCGKNPCECDDENKEDESCKKKNHSEDEDEEKDDNKDGEGEEEKEDESCKKKNHSEDEVCPDCGKNPCECDDENKEDESCKKKNHSLNNEKEDFSLSLNNVFKSIRKTLESITYEYESYWGDIFECEKYYAEDLIPDDSVVIIYDCEEDVCYGVPYSVAEDDVVLDLNNKVEYIKEWRKRNSSVSRFSLEKDETKREAVLYNKVAEELHNLRKFKSDIEEKENKLKLKEEVERILADFNFEEEEISELKEKALNNEMDLEKFEDKLCVLEVKKQRHEKEKFSKINTENNGLNVADVNDEESKKESKYKSILEQYGKKNK